MRTFLALTIVGATSALVGCAGRSALSDVPLFANLAVTAVATYYEQGVTGLSDADLKENARIMASVSSLTANLDAKATAYKVALDAEIARRGI